MFEERPIDGNLDRAAKCRFSNPTALERMFSESVLAVRFILHAPPQGPDFNFLSLGCRLAASKIAPTWAVSGWVQVPSTKPHNSSSFSATAN